MASERLENGKALPNLAAEEVAETARRLALRIVNDRCGFTLDDLLIDVSLCPIASDSEGHTKRAIEAIRLIGRDSELRGVHLMVGLSNLGIMLPKLALDGSRLSTKLESAFLTLTVPHGLDTILATPGRDYQILPGGRLRPARLQGSHRPGRLQHADAVATIVSKGLAMTSLALVADSYFDGTRHHDHGPYTIEIVDDSIQAIHRATLVQAIATLTFRSHGEAAPDPSCALRHAGAGRSALPSVPRRRRTRFPETQGVSQRAI